jgi:uncharacterized protein
LIVVSNSSPLISLGAIDRLELLHELFGDISIPDAVLQEVRSVQLSAVRWIVPSRVESPLLSRALEAELDRGEAEAIALAVELRADLLLMDERRGRRLATGFGLKVLGVLGILVAAKRRSLIQNVEHALKDLREKAGFRVSPALYQRALEEAEEA